MQFPVMVANQQLNTALGLCMLEADMHVHYNYLKYMYFVEVNSYVFGKMLHEYRWKIHINDTKLVLKL